MGFVYPPFFQTDNGRIDGIAVEFGQKLFARLNIQSKLTILPLKRGLDILKNGEADACMILIKTPERDTFLHFTDPLLTVRGLIWSAANRKNGRVQFDRLEDLKQYRIGVTRGYSYGADFDKLLETMNVDVTNSDYLNYIKLVDGRIDIFPGNEIVAGGIFKAHPELRDQLVHSEKSFIEWDLRIAISRKSPYATMLPVINATLSDMKKEGVMGRLVKKYTQ